MAPLKRIIVILAVAVAAFGSNAAMSQTMEFSCPAAGTKISFNSGDSTTITGQEGFFCKAQHSKFGAGETYALLYGFNAQRRSDPNWAKYISPIAVERIWPLAVGKNHKGQVTLGGATFFLEYTVTGMEVISTPMGPQNTFVLELKESSSAGYRANQKWWISPALKYVLKGEFGDSIGKRSNYHVTAVSTQ